MAVARLHVRSWQVAYRSLRPDDCPNRVRPADRAQPYDFASPERLKRRTIVVAEGINPWICHHSVVARTRFDRPWRIVCAVCGSEQWGRVMDFALVSDARARPFELAVETPSCESLLVNVRAQRFCQIDG